MATTVNVHEAKTHFSKLLERAHAGEEIILAKSGKPYALLAPLPAPAPMRQPGRLTGKIPPEFFDPLPEEELKAWERVWCACCWTPTACCGGGSAQRN